MSKQTIAVVGGTGTQGGSVVDALLDQGTFSVRVLTRNPESEKARELTARGVEVVAADLTDPSTVEAAFEGAHGAFIVTDFWNAASGTETEQGNAAVAAAKAAGVDHLIWSTLPNVEKYSNGELAVEHFTGKALVDETVAEAGFAHYTFVEPPFYFQNLAGMMGPQPLGDGRTGWAVTMDPDLEVMQMGDISDFGRVVARAFEVPAQVNGQHLAVATGRISWTDIAAELNSLGHDLSVAQIPDEMFDGLFPGAPEIREMYQWFEQYGYFGPDAEQKLAQTRAIYPEPFTTFPDWATTHMPPSEDE